MCKTVKLNTFSDELAVELVNPLTTVTGFADLILHKSKDPKTRNHAQVIKDAAERIKSYAESLKANYEYLEQKEPHRSSKSFNSDGKNPQHPALPSLLVIDDEAMITDMLCESLSDSFNVHTCNSPTECERTIEKRNFDLIMCDMRMPEVGGLDVLKIAKKRQPETPVLMTSGLSPTDDLIKEAIASGASGLIPKPFGDTFMLRDRLLSHIPDSLHC